MVRRGQPHLAEVPHATRVTLSNANETGLQKPLLPPAIVPPATGLAEVSRTIAVVAASDLS